MASLLPVERLDIDLRQGPAETARVATLTPHGGWVARVAGERFDV